ncbi:MAG TPA: septum formation initiator family protein [Verrucomicrobiae bacterium]|jgi:cell division protein FtsL|nr:septum formation initiator family protein [Verrucomicrobiae bacterium]
MPKLKKNQSAVIRLGPVLKVVFLCFLIAGSAVGYVWQKSQIYQLGRQISQCEIHLSQLKSDNQRMADQLAILRSPMMLDQRARQLNLGLAPAQPGQVYRLPEPVIAAMPGATIAMRPNAR